MTTTLGLEALHEQVRVKLSVARTKEAAAVNRGDREAVVDHGGRADTLDWVLERIDELAEKTDG
jgi:hypothetical protein